MFGKSLRNKTVLQFLSTVLNRSDTEYQKSSVSLQGEKRMYNFYSTCILIDGIIKYDILIREERYFNLFIEQLEVLAQSYQNHQELIIGIHALLGNIIQKQLGLKDLVQYENKRKVLERIYDRYIVNGYCFHSFPSVFQEEIESYGIRPQNYQYPFEQMKQIAHIFENHHYQEVITKSFHEKNPVIYLTDSPLMAYYYAISSPQYLCHLSATSAYMKEEDYDTFAYYRKDYHACRKNLEQLGKHVHLSMREHQVVSDAFKEQWQQLKIEEAVPCIAVIPRSVIGRNQLLEIAHILEEAKEAPFVVSMAKITDSRYPDDAYEKPILPLDFTVECLPTYREIEQGLEEEREKKKETVAVPKVEEMKQPIEELFPTTIDQLPQTSLPQESKKEKKKGWHFKKKREKTQPLTPPKDDLFPPLEVSQEQEQKAYEKKENEILIGEPINNHGYADVFALSGLLCIISGLTLILIFNYFGIR